MYIIRIPICTHAYTLRMHAGWHGFCRCVYICKFVCMLARVPREQQRERVCLCMYVHRRWLKVVCASCQKQWPLHMCCMCLFMYESCMYPHKIMNKNGCETLFARISFHLRDETHACMCACLLLCLRVYYHNFWWISKYELARIVTQLNYLWLFLTPNQNSSSCILASVSRIFDCV
jgi:hypothetical protein